MCVGIPSQIIEYPAEGLAVVDVAGARTKVSMLLLPDARVGDFVIVHAGFAIKLVDEQEAMETIRILREIAEASPDTGFEHHGDPLSDRPLSGRPLSNRDDSKK